VGGKDFGRGWLSKNKRGPRGLILISINYMFSKGGGGGICLSKKKRHLNTKGGNEEKGGSVRILGLSPELKTNLQIT